MPISLLRYARLNYALRLVSKDDQFLGARYKRFL